MFHINYYMRFFVVVSWSVLLISCTTQPVTSLTKYPIEFEAAVQKLANHLLAQINNNQSGFKLFGKTHIALDPFVDVNIGSAVNASRDIERIIFEEGSKHFPDFLIKRISPQNLRNAHYVMSGIISLGDYKTAYSTQTEKYYRIIASVTDLKSGNVVANSSIWVLDIDLDYTTTSIHKNNLLYFKDNLFKGLVATAKSQVGEQAHEDYYGFLDTNALLVEAETVYELGDYKTALILFKQVAERPDSEIMRAYAGLYETNFKLGQIAFATQAFDKLLDISVKQTGKLNVKLLFSVNSTAFIKNENLRSRYTTWLNRIGYYFNHKNLCFQIVGHTSRTGSKHHNNRLSLERARAVQKIMRANFPNIMRKSRAVGKGFQENIVSLGTDDVRDAIDRRVEFVVVNCH